MNTAVLRYLRTLDDLEGPVTVSWMLKINQIGHFSEHKNRLKHNHLADVEWNIEPGSLQV